MKERMKLFFGIISAIAVGEEISSKQIREIELNKV